MVFFNRFVLAPFDSTRRRGWALNGRMFRKKRCLFDFSLFLCLTLLWFVSYWRTVSIIVTVDHSSNNVKKEWVADLTSSAGGVGFYAAEQVYAYAGQYPGPRPLLQFYHDKKVAYPLFMQDSFWNRIGFGAFLTSQPRPAPTRRFFNVAIPYVFLAIVTGLLMVIFSHLPRRRQRQRMALGLCVGCGYDLRASGERCPECGSGSRKGEPKEAEKGTSTISSYPVGSGGGDGLDGSWHGDHPLV